MLYYYTIERAYSLNALTLILYAVKNKYKYTLFSALLEFYNIAKLGVLAELLILKK